MSRRVLRRCAVLVISGAVATGAAEGVSPEPPPLLPAQVIAAIAQELSGTEARHTVQELTLFHRMRGSRGFGSAAAAIAARARAYGLPVEVISLPADGIRFYGTQRSRPAWDADFAELWEQHPDQTGVWVDSVRVASWENRPIVLAEDSAGGEAAADLVDVGEGSTEADYRGKDVRGKLVLVGAQPGAVSELAIDRFGAVGIVSYAPNQPTAWWREDETLVRWGHLSTFPPPHTFALMVSLRQARTWKERLASGDAVHLHASVKAGQHPGTYDIVTAVIAGADPVLRDQEIVLSCHLDHQRPGANDNASGCATILEVARTLSKLIAEHRLAPPRRTLRFIWPAEVEGTLAFLNGRPDLARRARAVIHMDMVGGDTEITKSIFHVTRSPRSLPSFVNDVGEAFGRFVNAQSDAFASTGEASFPLVDPEGSKRALQAEVVDFTPGSDHEVWSEGSWRVPAIYLNDWPDRYIHTHADSVANIDPTKLLRAAFIGAASAYYLAQLDSSQVPALWTVIRGHALERTATALARRAQLQAEGLQRDGEELLLFNFRYEEGVVRSMQTFAEIAPAVGREAETFVSGLRQLADPTAASVVEPPIVGQIYRRNPEPKGPMTGFGYSYFEDRSQREKVAPPALLKRKGWWGDEYAYEALNLVDGRRSVQQIRDALTATFGPVPLTEVAEYLGALRRVGVLAFSVASPRVTPTPH
jgi:aminopeptidase YwaD